MVKSGKRWIFIIYFYTRQYKIVTNYIGEYACKVDVKGRVMMPAGLLRQFPAALRERFVINRSVFQRCLVLYPMDLWEDTLKDLGKLNRFNKDNDNFIRQFTNGAASVEMDSTNRILLPKRLGEYAGIKNDLVMAANLNKIEIWSAENYNAVTDSYDPDSFAQLAEKVMGGMNEDNGL